MFEVILNNKKSKYREKPVMNIDVDDPCSWEELKDKPVIPENVGYIEQRLSGVELRVESIESEMENDTTLADAKSYADEQDTTTLASAKSYADGKDTTTLADAKSYADEQDTTTLADAKSYADEQDTTTLADAKSYADGKDATTLADAKSYADEQDTTTLDSAKSYADEKSTTTLASAKSYADGKLNNVSYIKSSSIPTSGWTTKTGYYEINITVSGLDVTNASVIIDADTYGTGDINTITNIDESWSKVVKIVASTNNLYVAATEIPSVAIPLKIAVVRYTT